MLHDDPSAAVGGQLVVPSPLLPASIGPLVAPVQAIAGGGGSIADPNTQMPQVKLHQAVSSPHKNRAST